MSYTIGLESNQFREFKVAVEGVDITPTQVTSFKMKYTMDSTKIEGLLVFTDLNTIVTTLPIRGGNKVKVELEDYDEEKNKQTMIVVDVKYTKLDSGTIMTTLQLLDETTFKATAIFNEMSFKKATITDMIDHDETYKDIIGDKDTDYYSAGKKYENFVFPMNASLNMISVWLSKNNNVKWFQTRDKFILQPLSKLFGRSPKGDDFIYKTPNQYYRRKIYEYDVHIGKALEHNMFQSKAKVASFTPKNKHAKWTGNDFKKSINDVNSTGNINPNIEETDAKHYYKSNNNIENYVKYMWDDNTYKFNTMEVLVPGQFTNNVGNIVHIDTYTIEPDAYTLAKQEENISGDWMIYQIVDIFAVPDFIQRLVLVRTKFKE